MHNSPSLAPYLISATHRTTAQLHVQQQHPLTHCHTTQPFVQVVRKPPFAFHSPALDLTGQSMPSSHPFQLNLNDNLFTTTHCRPASSCQPVPSELGLHLSTGHKGERCPRTPDQNSMNPWTLPTGAGRPSGITTGRPWPKAAGLTPDVFLSGGDTQPYNGFLLEPTDGGPSFSPDSEAFNTAALSVVPTPIIVADTPRRDQPQDLAVYFSGSESDSGLEPDDERSIARQDQWTSISAASPR